MSPACKILVIAKNFTSRRQFREFSYRGGSYNQFKVSFKKLGIEAQFAKDDAPESFEELINENTKAIYLETIGNPTLNVADFDAVAAVAKKHNIPLIVDNTFGAGGYLFRPIEHGANVVVESAMAKASLICAFVKPSCISLRDFRASVASFSAFVNSVKASL